MKTLILLFVLILVMPGGQLSAQTGDLFFKGSPGSEAQAAEPGQKAGESASGPAKSDQTKSSETPADQATPGQTMDTAEFIQQISYSLGFDIFTHLSRQVDLDLDFFLQGIEDARQETPKLSEDQMKQMLMAYQRLARQKAREAARETLEKNRSQGNIFLEGNKLKEGVVTLSSGLQYKVLTEGTGPVPGADSTVECHYRGTLLDGTEFDSSHARGRPAVFQVNRVIQGWSEALVRMPVGSRWMLYIPSELAYGDQGAGDIIEPGHALIFEVELLGILE